MGKNEAINKLYNPENQGSDSYVFIAGSLKKELENMNNKKQITVDLHFIGKKAEKLQAMYSGYSEWPNEYGSFLRFENYTYVAGNDGVMLYTNCFESEAEFMENLTSKLLLDL